MIHILDLGFLGIEKAIAAFLVETSDGPVLIETGPHSTLPQLTSAVNRVGYQVKDIQHVLLSHIHLDHAGAAWTLADHAAIYVHPFGARHLGKPEKLMESARRIYQDQMDRLWGEMQDIPEEKLRIVEDEQEITIGDKVFRAWHTPGHAHHHIAWQLDDVVFTGDIAGVKIDKGPVVPPCPPPDIDLEKWNASIQRVLATNPSKLYLTHFGIIDDCESHMIDLIKMLNDWAFWIKAKWEEGLSAEELTPKFSQYTADQLRDLGVNEAGIKRYEAANPSWMSVAGLIRYWKTKAERTG